MDSIDEPLHIRASLERLKRQLADGWQDQLAALRTSLEQQVASINDRLAGAGVDELNAVADELTRSALDQAERVRQDVQGAADTVHAELQGRLESEATSNAMLRDALAEAKRQVDAAKIHGVTLEAARTAIEAQHREATSENQKITALLADTQRQAEAAQRESAAHLAALTGARQQIETISAEQGLLQQQHEDLEASRARLEGQHHELVAASQKLTDALAGLQLDLETLKRDRETLKQERDVHFASLTSAERRVETLTAEGTALREQMRDLAARADQDALERGALAAATEEARETAKQAKAETKTLLKATVDHVRTINEGFALLRDGLHAFHAAKTPADVWQTLATQLGHSFSRAAVFMVRDNCFERTNVTGFDGKTGADQSELSLTSDSILARALREKATVALHAGIVGLFGEPADHGVAIPVLSAGRIVAVVYAEQPRIVGNDGARTSAMMAESLTFHAGTCAAAVAVRRETSAQEPAAVSPKKVQSPAAGGAAFQKKVPLQFQGPARDAQRVIIQRGTQIALDGIPGELIDLSIGGAQLLLTQSVRPNQLVRLTLPGEGTPVACKGRVVWSVFEQSRTSVAMYRAGLKFTDADAAAIEAFMKDFQEKPVMLKAHSASGAA